MIFKPFGCALALAMIATPTIASAKKPSRAERYTSVEHMGLISAMDTCLVATAEAIGAKSTEPASDIVRVVIQDREFCKKEKNDIVGYWIDAAKVDHPDNTDAVLDAVTEGNDVWENLAPLQADKMRAAILKARIQP